MRHPRWFTTLGTNEHSIRDMNRHRFINDASLASLALRFDMLLHHIQALNNYLVDLWHCPGNDPLFSSILTGDNQDGITFLDIHFGKMERLLLFLSYCHIFPLKFVACLCRTRGTTNINENYQVHDTCSDTQRVTC